METEITNLKIDWIFAVRFYIRLSKTKIILLPGFLDKQSMHNSSAALHGNGVLRHFQPFYLP